MKTQTQHSTHHRRRRQTVVSKPWVTKIKATLGGLVAGYAGRLIASFVVEIGKKLLGH